jgi:molecular chaperone GrpE
VTKELDELQREYAGYRQRAGREKKQAEDRARAEVARSLVGLVDDCDRALESIDDLQVASGVEALRNRALERFEGLGLFSFAARGDFFDPELHEAIATDPDSAEGVISQVHARGWRNSRGKILRVAQVTVGKERS